MSLLLVKAKVSECYIFNRFGGLYYCPSTIELDALPPFTEKDLYPTIPFWMRYRSTNPLLFYNHIQYLYTMTTNQYGCQLPKSKQIELCDDPPSKRILHLMSRAFARWHSTWSVIEIQILIDFHCINIIFIGITNLMFPAYLTYKCFFENVSNIS